MSVQSPDVQTVLHGHISGKYASWDQIARLAQDREAGVYNGCTLSRFGTALTIDEGDARIGRRPTHVDAIPVPDLNTVISTVGRRWILIEVDPSGTSAILTPGDPTSTPTGDPLPPPPTPGYLPCYAVCAEANTPAGTETRQKIVNAQGTNDQRIIDLRQFLSWEDRYSLVDCGITTDLTPSDLTIGCRDLADWIRNRRPGAEILVDPGAWHFNPIAEPVFWIRNDLRVAGANPYTSELWTDANSENAIFGQDITSDITAVEVRKLTFRGQRYLQQHQHVNVGGINLSSGKVRRGFLFEWLNFYEPKWYAISASGVGLKEDWIYRRIYVENAGSDGLDERGNIPWGRNLRAEYIDVYGCGFEDDGRSAGFDMRECWDCYAIRVRAIANPASVGISFRTGVFDGSTSYPNMWSSVQGGMIALTGAIPFAGMQKGSQNVEQMPGHAVSPIAMARPVMVPIGGWFDYNARTLYNTFAPISYSVRKMMPQWRLVISQQATNYAGKRPALYAEGGQNWSFDDRASFVAGQWQFAWYRSLPMWNLTDMFDWQNTWAVDAATTAALPAHTATATVLTATANGAFPTIDGVAAALNKKYLVKNQAAGAHVEHGVYQLTTLGTGATPWVLTRLGDANAGPELLNGYVQVQGGTVNGPSSATGQEDGTGWRMTTASPVTVGTTAMLWQRQGGATGLTPNDDHRYAETAASFHSLHSGPYDNTIAPVPNFAANHIGGTPAGTQNWVGLFAFEMENGSCMSGKHPLSDLGSVWVVDFGENAADSIRNAVGQSIGLPAGGAALSPALPAFDTLAGEPQGVIGYDGSGQVTVENALFAFFLNNGLGSRKLVPQNDQGYGGRFEYERVMEKIDPLTGRVVTFLYYPAGDKVRIGGVVAGQVADPMFAGAMELRGSRTAYT